MKARQAPTFDDWLKVKLRDRSFREHYRQAKLAAEIGHSIVALRRRSRLTQAELARRMGTKQQTISRLERGDYEGFTLKTLMKLAEATRTDLTITFKAERRTRVRVG